MPAYAATGSSCTFNGTTPRNGTFPTTARRTGSSSTLLMVLVRNFAGGGFGRTSPTCGTRRGARVSFTSATPTETACSFTVTFDGGVGLLHNHPLQLTKSEEHPSEP